MSLKDGMSAVQNKTISELHRVGLGKIVEMRYSTRNIYRQIFDELLEKYHNVYGIEWPMIKTKFDCMFNHYETIKLAYELGVDHILILEDDVRFLKNIDTIKEYLEELPAVADLALFDYIHFPNLIKYDITDYFFKFDSYMLFSDMYALSRNGMKYMIDNMEARVLHADSYFCIDNNILFNFDGNGLKKYPNMSNIEPIKVASSLQLCCQAPETNDRYTKPSEFIVNNNLTLYNI